MEATTHVVSGADDELIRVDELGGPDRKPVLVRGLAAVLPRRGRPVLTAWGCDLATVRVPVRLWHGVRDRAVPVAHGRWLAAHVPGLVAQFPEPEDHTNVEHSNRAAAYAWLSGLA